LYTYTYIYMYEYIYVYIYIHIHAYGARAALAHSVTFALCYTMFPHMDKIGNKLCRQWGLSCKSAGIGMDYHGHA